MRIRALFAALALVLVGVIIPAAPAGAIAPPSGNPTSCAATAQLRNLGDRTCFDKSAGTITIYSGSTTVYTSFAASGATTCSAFIATPGEWTTSNATQTAVVASGFGSPPMCSAGALQSVENGTASGYVLAVAGSNHDLLEWFAAGNTHEFVVVP